MLRLACLDLQRGLVAQDVVGVVAERAWIKLDRSCGQFGDGSEPQVNELLALIATSKGDEAEVVVGSAARLALETQGADRAVRNRLGVRRQCVAEQHGLDLTDDVAMQRRVSTERDLLSTSIAQDHVRKRRVITLGVPEQPAVETELMDDLRFDLPCELGVEHFVDVLPEVRRCRQPTQEVRAPLPAAVEELRLVDERRSFAYRLRRLLGGSIKVLARVRGDVTRQVLAVVATGPPLREPPSPVRFRRAARSCRTRGRGGRRGAGRGTSPSRERSGSSLPRCPPAARGRRRARRNRRRWR